MPRSRQIGLTEELKSKVLHVDRLSPSVRKNVAYDVRMIIEKELEDLDWFFSEAPKAFRRMRDRELYYPLEAVMPADPKRAHRTLEELQKWKEAINLVEAAILELGLRYMKSRR